MESKLSDRRRESKELKLGLKGLASSQRSIGLKTGPSTRSTDPMRTSLERKPLLSLSERRRASKQLKIDDLSSPMPVDRSPIIEDNAESLQTPQLECLNVRPQAMRRIDSLTSNLTKRSSISNLQTIRLRIAHL